MIKFTSRLNYTCHWLVNSYFSEANFRENKVDISPKNTNSINMICFSVHKLEAVQKVNNMTSYIRINVSSGSFSLPDYNLSYTGQ